MERMAQMVLALMLIFTGSLSWAIEPSFGQQELLNGITLHYRWVTNMDIEVSFYTVSKPLAPMEKGNLHHIKNRDL